MLTEFGIHHRLESCVVHLTVNNFLAGQVQSNISKTLWYFEPNFSVLTDTSLYMFSYLYFYFKVSNQIIRQLLQKIDRTVNNEMRPGKGFLFIYSSPSAFAPDCPKLQTCLLCIIQENKNKKRLLTGVCHCLHDLRSKWDNRQPRRVRVHFSSVTKSVISVWFCKVKWQCRVK